MCFDRIAGFEGVADTVEVRSRKHNALARPTRPTPPIRKRVVDVLHPK